MELELANVQSEMLVIGSLFKDPTIYLTYSQSIVPHCDFSDKACEFFYYAAVISPYLLLHIFSYNGKGRFVFVAGFHQKCLLHQIIKFVFHIRERNSEFYG